MIDILEYLANGIALFCIAMLAILVWGIFDDNDKHGY